AVSTKLLNFININLLSLIHRLRLGEVNAVDLLTKVVSRVDERTIEIRPTAITPVRVCRELGVSKLVSEVKNISDGHPVVVVQSLLGLLENITSIRDGLILNLGQSLDSFVFIVPTNDSEVISESLGNHSSADTSEHIGKQLVHKYNPPIT